ncbi:MAG TPA: B12-binding domain-containing protein [Acidimicrobiia bacterium]|nr:B12-binding domain-containing protein [Acidimicrobiia bacterium]
MPFDVAAVRQAARFGDHRTVRRLCLEEADGGTPVRDIVDVLARLQEEIGEHWLAGEVTAADEHRSTAAVDAALAALELHLGPPPAAPPVVCVCAEGEWHAVASRMAALVFAAAGRPTIFLGPSLPAGDLARFVTGARAAAVAISCSTVAALPGAARCVAAVGAAGVPVLVGGQAFRAVPAAAGAFGALNLDDAQDAALALEGLPPPGPAADLDTASLAALDAVRTSLVDVASNGILARRPLGADAAGVVEDALDYALGFGRAAVLLRHRSVLRDHERWLEAFLAGRVAPVSAEEVLAALGCAVEEVLGGHKELHEVFGL